MNMNNEKEEIKANELIEHFGSYADATHISNDGSWDSSDDITRKKNGTKIAIQAVEFLIENSNRTEEPISFWKGVLNILKSKDTP